MKKKIKIGVLMGGPSAEREISLITGKAIFDNLDKAKYLPALIEMGKDSSFNLDFIKKDRKRFDIIFIAMHGTPGEDGTLQGMFEALNIKYTGSNTLSSALSMNKVFAGQIYIVNHLPHPKFIHIKADGWKNYRPEVLNDVKEKITYPAVVKPVDQGSAVGVCIVKNENELISFIDKTIKKFPWLMVQKFIKGQEATCGVIEIKGELAALPPTRILPNLGEFYDYKSKYKKGGSTHICPADFSPDVNEQIKHLALLAHKALCCGAMSRTDIFVADEKDEHGHNKLYIIETNTIPGMTPTSLFPEAADKAGIPFKKLLDIIIEASL